jgi:hypothetical protein
MGYVPQGAQWYLAELLMEITVHGGRCNVLHRNLILVNAHSPEEAYNRALKHAWNGETEYKNPKGQLVEIRFRGIARLDVVYEPLEDGAELSFEERLGVSEEEIRAMITPKEQLRAFIPPSPGLEHDPDYRSKAIMDTAIKMGEGGGFNRSEG